MVSQLLAELWRKINNISVTNTAGGNGTLSYDKTTEVFTYTGPTSADIRSHFTAGGGITISNGVISATYTGPTSADIRSHFTAGNGITISNGVISATNSSNLTAGDGITISNGVISATNSSNTFYYGNTTIAANVTIPTGLNAMTPGPVTVANNVVVTVPDGSTWTIV